MTNADDSMKTLCHLSIPLFGERVIRCSEGIEITSTPDGFIVNDRPLAHFTCDSTEMDCRPIMTAMY